MQKDMKKQGLMEEYAEFMAVNDEAEAFAFWEAHTPDPVGKPYFTPSDYYWQGSTLRLRLQEGAYQSWWAKAPFTNMADFAHNHRSWRIYVNRLWFWKSQPAMVRENQKFMRKVDLLIRAKVKAQEERKDALYRWLYGRYDITQESCLLLPDQFATSEKESPEYWDLTNNLAIIEEQEGRGLSGYKVLYYWKKVDPAEEKNPADGRRHIILMDRATHKEAPLKPGQLPYSGN